MKLPSFWQYDVWQHDHSRHAIQDTVQYGTAVVHKMTRTLTAREEKCTPGNNSSFCQKPISGTNVQTLPIVLGAVIPICCAIVVFVFLHRRGKKRQAIEDANDPHKSLDFGTEFNEGRSKANKRGRNGPTPEMSIPELGPDPMRPNRLARGMSMDLMGSPYLLPPGLQGSRESIHSMSRSMQDEHDPYRPVAYMRDSTETSRYPRMTETGSVYSASTVQTGNDRSVLLTNASTMSQSFPKRGDSMNTNEAKSPIEPSSSREMYSASRSMASSRKTSLSSTAPTLAHISETPPPQKVSRKESLPPSLPPMPPAPEQEAYESHELYHKRSSFSTTRPPRKESMPTLAPPAVVERPTSDSSFYGDEMPPPPPPKVMEPEDYSIQERDSGAMYSGRFSIDTPAPSQQYPIQDNQFALMQNNRVSVMGLRPLPPDHPEENPEQRANRIRSFYKEYFDANRPNPGGYYEDWDPSYVDANTNGYDDGDYYYPQPAYAQPMGRRAMTPPPRGASQFQGGEHSRHFSTMSGGGPRGRPVQRPPPKKNLPPPKALTSLPTPHLLGTDQAIMNAGDFAPPTSFRERQNGRRPDSPLGTPRPYSPSVRPYSPLVPARNELNVMPSPHALRKSGTFTSLDFAALPRFRGQEGAGSDAGSIRSARSGISAMQMDAVRAGAYRVSRIPKEYVTSREDLSTQLRPKWDLVSPA